jgi:hypothetical protein
MADDMTDPEAKRGHLCDGADDPVVITITSDRVNDLLEAGQ